MEDEIDLSSVNLTVIIAVFFWFMFVMQLIGYLFPKQIELKDKYLEYKFLANKTVIPYSEIKVFLRKNFLVKLYLITDSNRKRKIAFTGLSDQFINEFEEALEIKLIENKII